MRYEVRDPLCIVRVRKKVDLVEIWVGLVEVVGVPLEVHADRRLLADKDVCSATHKSINRVGSFLELLCQNLPPIAGRIEQRIGIGPVCGQHNSLRVGRLYLANESPADLVGGLVQES